MSREKATSYDKEYRRAVHQTLSFVVDELKSLGIDRGLVEIFEKLRDKSKKMRYDGKEYGYFLNEVFDRKKK